MTGRLALAACILLILAGLSLGYVPLRESDGIIVSWDLETANQPNVIDGRITYFQDPAGTIDVPTGVAEAVAVRRAFQAWEDVETSRIAFVEDEDRTALGQDSTDRVNLIAWMKGYLPPGTLALTFPYSQNGTLTDVDIILNDDMDWDTSEVGRDFVADVQSVLTHEIGHMIGLDHVPLAQSTMYPSLPLGAIRVRSLEADDIAGITALYPEPSAAHLGGIRGRVTVDGKGDGRGVLIVALDPATRMPAASALTTTDGLYEMQGLEPGAYRLFAFPLHGQGGMTPYWKETNSQLSGRIYGVTGRGPGRAALVDVVYSATTFGINFPDVRLDVDDDEPNDRPADSLLLSLEDSVIGTAGEVMDEDWYRFEGHAGDRIAIHVDARHIGADTNVQLDLYGPGMVDADGVVLTDGEEPIHPSCIDIRPPIIDENRTSLEGVDTDAWLTEATLEKDGYHFIRVTFSPNSNVGLPVNYYLLTLYRDSRTPDDRATEVTALPAAVPAVPGLSARIRVVAKNLAGEILTDPMTVKLTGQGIGTIGEAEQVESGVYEVPVGVPDAPGRETFTVTLSAESGSTVLWNAVTLNYLGAPDPSRSEFEALPGRIEADGTAVTRLSLRMRDSAGDEFGPGLPVRFEFVDAPDGRLGDVRDEGDGEYTCEVTASAVVGSDKVAVGLGTEMLDLLTRVHYGFLLGHVIDDALLIVGELRADEATPRAADKKLRKVEKKLVRARDLLATGEIRNEAKALQQLYRAVKPWRQARLAMGGAGPEFTFDFAEAARRYVGKAIEGAEPDAEKPRQVKNLEKAVYLHGSAVEHINSGIREKALKELAKAQSLLP